MYVSGLPLKTKLLSGLKHAVDMEVLIASYQSSHTIPTSSIFILYLITYLKV